MLFMAMQARSPMSVAMRADRKAMIIVFRKARRISSFWKSSVYHCGKAAPNTALGLVKGKDHQSQDGRIQKHKIKIKIDVGTNLFSVFHLERRSFFVVFVHDRHADCDKNHETGERPLPICQLLTCLNLLLDDISDKKDLASAEQVREYERGHGRYEYHGDAADDAWQSQRENDFCEGLNLLAPRSSAAWITSMSTLMRLL